MLGTSGRPLASCFELVMLDLDGVVYRGPVAVPGVARDLAAVRAAGTGLAFVTNNAARTPQVVAEHLVSLGVPAEPHEVVTSSQAAAGLLAQDLPGNAVVLVLGSPALAEAVRTVGLRPVVVGSAGWEEVVPVAVVSGFAPELVWSDLLRSAVLIREGLPWVAANTDLTFPAEFGVAPGHGALVALLEQYSGRRARVAGKPQPPLLLETMRRAATDRAVMVGDRLDTDIAAGRAVGVPSVLVMTGVSDLATLRAARGPERPDVVLDTLAGLGRAQAVPRRRGQSWTHGPWQVEVGGALYVLGAPADPQPHDWDTWWQVVAAASWAAHDETGDLPELVAPVLPPIAR